MDRKQITCLVVAALGVLMIGYGVYSKTHISTAEREIQKMTDSKNRIIRAIAKEMHIKVGRYGSRMNWCLFGGIVFAALGGSAFYYYRKH